MRYAVPGVCCAAVLAAAALLIPGMMDRPQQIPVIAHADSRSSSTVVVPPEDPAAALDPDESVILAQRKRLMGKVQSLEMVSRVAREIGPLVRKNLQLASIQPDMSALADSHGMSLPEFKEYFQHKQEADLLLESGGNPDAYSVSHAVGVAQFLSGTGRQCGLRINDGASRTWSRRVSALQSKIAWLEKQRPEWSKPRSLRGRPAEMWTRDQWVAAYRSDLNYARAKRRAVDERYDPSKAIRAQTRYLVKLARRYGSIAWALQAYHGGEGGVARTLRLYGGGGYAYGGPLPAYEEIYHEVSPLRRSDCFYYLYGRSDDHRYYWWKVLMAERAIRLYREDSEQFKAHWQALRPGHRMEVAWYGEPEPHSFQSRAHLSKGRAEGSLLPVPSNLHHRHIRLHDVAPLDRQYAGEYKALRPEAMGALLMLGSLYRSNGGREPILVTSLVQTVGTAREWKRLHPPPPPRFIVPGMPAEEHDFHATGLVFDLARPRSDWDRRVLEYALSRLYDRLRISWLVEEHGRVKRYHVTPNPLYREEFSRAAAAAGATRTRRARR